MILVFILHALFALVFPLARIAANASEPIFFTGIRMVIGGAIILAYLYYKDNKVFTDMFKYSWYILGLAFFNVFLTNAPEFWSLKYLTSSKASIIFTICPFVSAIFSYFLFAEKITKKKALGMIIGSVGFSLVLLHDTSTEQQVGSVFFLSWPEIAMIVSTLATVYGWIIMRQLIKHKAVSIISANGISMILGGLFSFIASYFLEDLAHPINNTNMFWLSLVSVIIVSNLICYNLYAYLLKKYTATLVAFVGFIEPLFAAFYGWIILGEGVPSNFFVSSIIILIGLYLFYAEELKQGYVVTETTEQNQN